NSILSLGDSYTDSSLFGSLSFNGAKLVTDERMRPQGKRGYAPAHAAACLAEHGWPLDGGEVIALTVDGIGMGENGALWGGECLR
ncbi:fimbria/pilus outer membrane usher protein, partial [Salmonella enterica subsp. enterica serovar Kentucky]|nr:fimbria/pilus outer membrane usher protein [Salmonella enterica subsp. enterica serovar Kentucky]